VLGDHPFDPGLDVAAILNCGLDLHVFPDCPTARLPGGGRALW
jgi:hypothetical protein